MLKLQCKFQFSVHKNILTAPVFADHTSFSVIPHSAHIFDALSYQ